MLFTDANAIQKGVIDYEKAEKFIRQWQSEVVHNPKFILEDYEALSLDNIILVYSILVTCTKNESNASLSPTRYAIAAIASDMKVMSGIREYLIEKLGSVSNLIEKTNLVAQSESVLQERISTSHLECPGCHYRMATKRCARCHLVSYCSRECQIKEWLNHKHQCSGQ